MKISGYTCMYKGTQKGHSTRLPKPTFLASGHLLRSQPLDSLSIHNGNPNLKAPFSWWNQLPAPQRP
jgi:hypothetical protein